MRHFMGHSKLGAPYANRPTANNALSAQAELPWSLLLPGNQG
ncbi:hypothetical protein ALQ79_200435 [Pseudomonas amygdali pv. lachrymans]|nr:hypothetical protein ALQ79_200435 [Pseudomonas amygdali pv. lachrymans]